jgi:hypothetical protein
VTAVSRASKVSYAIGKHTWKFTNDMFRCLEGQQDTTQLKITSCGLFSMFTCDDGQCIDMDERCNHVPNCRDESDEKGCQMMMLKESYNKLVPPITLPLKGPIVPVTVNISIELLKIVSMRETEHKIEPQFTIRLQWRETERARYQNLRRVRTFCVGVCSLEMSEAERAVYDASLNTLTLEEVNRMWLPLIIFSNTDQLLSTRLGNEDEWRTTVTVTRGPEDGIRSEYDNVDEFDIYDGPTSILTMEQSYTFEFQCHYELGNYPFDTQVIIDHS